MKIMSALAIATSTAVLTGTLGFLTSAASAVTLSNSSGTWVNPVGGGTTIEYATVGSENQIRWGNPAPNAPKSGLGFAGVGFSSFGFNTQFLVGTLQHYNYVTFGDVISAVDLLIDLDFSDVGGSPLSKAFTFSFGIDETNNAPPCAYFSTTPCSDRISFSNMVASETFDVAGQEYTLKLLEFGDSPTPGGALISDFISQEGGTSTAYLYGEITAAPPPETVPEPEAIAGLSMLGLCFMSRHWRKPSMKSAK